MPAEGRHGIMLDLLESAEGFSAVVADLAQEGAGVIAAPIEQLQGIALTETQHLQGVSSLCLGEQTFRSGVKRKFRTIETMNCHVFQNGVSMSISESSMNSSVGGGGGVMLGAGTPLEVDLWLEFW